MELYQILTENGGDLTDHNVAVLSDWAADMARSVPNPSWKRAYALIREGADLLLRRRARSTARETEGVFTSSTGTVTHG
jgi:hypothetical protein